MLTSLKWRQLRHSRPGPKAHRVQLHWHLPRIPAGVRVRAPSRIWFGARISLQAKGFFCQCTTPGRLDGPGIAGRADGGRFCRASPGSPLVMVHASPFSQPSALPFAIRRPPRSSPYSQSFLKYPVCIPGFLYCAQYHPLGRRAGHWRPTEEPPGASPGFPAFLGSKAIRRDARRACRRRLRSSGVGVPMFTVLARMGTMPSE